MKFTPVLPGQDAAIEQLSVLATSIIKEHFDPIIGPAQNDYMLEKFQSVPALREQLAQGYQYYFVERDNGERLGFLAFYPRGNELYLSKFYLKKEQRGRGYAREMLAFVVEKAQAGGLSAVTLNVNRHNDAINAYEKMGFMKTGQVKNDIGGGFYMDDFVYALPVEG
ncbi:MAG: GNAT family N-acetyltransferase [Clostridiales bacterium]|nr:GNAT family N-acetyltransferase [Clostridiales bacterium]